jgi:hypothetical protein
MHKFEGSLKVKKALSKEVSYSVIKKMKMKKVKVSTPRFNENEEKKKTPRFFEEAEE